MHMFSGEKKFYGGHGIVGAQVPLGTGLAFANKYRGERSRVPHLFRRRRRQPGPGLRSLQHGASCGSCRSSTSSRTISTPWARASSAPAPRRISTSAAPRSTFRASRSTAWMSRPCTPPARKAIEWCRAGKGPIILEMKTYRYRGHSMSRSGEVPHARGSAGGAREARSDRASRPEAGRSGSSRPRTN